MLAAALRILNDLQSRRVAAASDVDLIRSKALHEERDFDLDDLARCVARRNMAGRPVDPMVSGEFHD